MQNPIDILNELISINSQCTISNKKIIEYIKSRLGQFEVKEFKFKKGNLDLYNLVVKIPGQSSRSPIVFSGHTDTVPVSNEWTLDPFKPVLKENNLFGLGSSDMKAGLACMMAAALNVTNPKNDIYLLFDADEEGDVTGGPNLIKEFTLKNARVIEA